MNKAIFLDRDGTINVEKNYLHKIEDFEFLPGAIDGLKLLYGAGYFLIIITNQSGIGRGYYTEEEFIALNDWMMEELEKEGVHISKVYYCPHLPNARVEKFRKICTCRKPALGLFEQAMKDFDIDLSLSWAIGDKIRDCSICEKTACRGVLIAENEKTEIIKKIKNGGWKHIEYAIDLKEAAQKIVSNLINEKAF